MTAIGIIGHQVSEMQKKKIDKPLARLIKIKMRKDTNYYYHKWGKVNH